MKKLFTLIGVAALLAATTHAADALLNGNTSTNFNAIYNAAASATNSTGVITNNYQNGQVPGASNVFYTVSSLTGAQPQLGTNGFLPSLVLNVKGGFQNSLTAPARAVTIALGGQLMATNATSTTVTFQFFAYDASGLVLQTNYQTATLIFPGNSVTATNVQFTSFDSQALGYVGLQQINNPGVAALTNIVVDIHSKSGL